MLSFKHRRYTYHARRASPAPEGLGWISRYRCRVRCGGAGVKDLLLYVADADAAAFMTGVLNKPQALEIRPITFDAERHPQRDNGMVQSGAELARMKKGKYQKVLMAWDHHGSGREHRYSPEEVRKDVQGRLDSYTWSGNNSICIFVPELEQWLWFCESALLAHCGITESQLGIWVASYAEKKRTPVDTIKKSEPKELFEHIMYDCLRRTISPRDFEEIGRRASVTKLMNCESFRDIILVLRSWFPIENTGN